MILFQFDLLAAIVNIALSLVSQLIGSDRQRLKEDRQSIASSQVLVLWVVDGIDLFYLKVYRFWLSILIEVCLRVKLTVRLFQMECNSLHGKSVVGKAVD